MTICVILDFVLKVALHLYSSAKPGKQIVNIILRHIGMLVKLWS